MSSRYTAAIRKPALDRVRALRGFIPDFIIADFISEAVDRQVRLVCRRRKINLPAELRLPDNGK